jgi:hypothetical protein
MQIQKLSRRMAVVQLKVVHVTTVFAAPLQIGDTSLSISSLRSFFLLQQASRNKSV